MPDHNVAAGSAPLRARYGDAAPRTDAWSPVIASMLEHRSVRAYTDAALPPGTLEILVAAAQSAATSSNLQLWSVVAVEDQGRRDRLAALAGGQKHISQAPLFLCWVADLSRSERVGVRHETGLEALPYLETFMVAVIDAALAAQNASAAAESLGLGTVYIGAMRNHPERVAEELGLPPDAAVVFGLCVGHIDPAAEPMVKPRLPQSVVLHREQYRAEADSGIAGYDSTLKSFQSSQSMREQGWSELVLGRLGPVAAMSGRDRLREALATMGVQLR